MNIRGKMLIPIIISIGTIGALLYFIISLQLVRISQNQMELSRAQFTSSVESSIQSNIDLIYNTIDSISQQALEYSTMFNAHEKVIEAYRVAHTGDINDPESPQSQRAREMLRDFTYPIWYSFRESNPAANFRVHYHLSSVRSLMRTWRENFQTTVDGKKVDISDDLSGFRSTLNQMSRSPHNAVQGIETGRGGFVIRGITPVMDGPKYMGSVEMYYDFTPLFNIVDISDDTEIASFMNKDLLQVATSLNDPEKYPVAGDEFVLTVATDQQKIMDNLDLELLIQGRKGQVIMEKGDYIFASAPLYDFSGEAAGVVMLINDISAENAEFALIEEQNRKSSRQLEVYLGAGVGLALLSVIILVSLMVNSLVKNIRRITDTAVDVSTGRLDVDVSESTGKDEIAKLNNSFYRMVRSLRIKSDDLETIAGGDLTREISLNSDKDQLGMSMLAMEKSLTEIISSIKASINVTSMQSTQVRQANNQLSETIMTQAASLEEMSSSLQQIDSEANQNAVRSKEASGIAGNATERADKANSAMGNLTDAMQQITVSSNEITGVVKLIDDIAFQINLLALNANVEAARAGKYGRGFAVVAEEVRNLANRSAEAVKQTQGMVENSMRNVQTGNSALEETSGYLTSIQGEIKNILEHLNDISDSSTRQALSIREITTAMGQIDDISQTNAASAEETSAAADEMAKAASDITELMKFFHIRDDKAPYLELDAPDDFAE